MASRHSWPRIAPARRDTHRVLPTAAGKRRSIRSLFAFIRDNLEWRHRMRSLTSLFLSALVAATLILPAQADDFWQHPAIKDGGAVHPLPEAAIQPDRSQTYKVVFSVTKAASDPKDVNDALDHVARAVNVFVSAGIPLDHLKFVAI